MFQSIYFDQDPELREGSIHYFVKTARKHAEDYLPRILLDKPQAFLKYSLDYPEKTIKFISPLESSFDQKIAQSASAYIQWIQNDSVS